MFNFMPHFLYNIKIRTLGFPCHVNQFLPYTPSLRVPYVWGLFHLETHNCHLGNDYNNRPNKVINDFNIFLGINITINNCQSIQLLLVMQPQIIKLTQHHDLDSRTVESILHRVVTK